MKLIGITGQAHSGKGEVAKAIAPFYQARFLNRSVTVREGALDGALVPGAQEIALADPIKIIATGTYDFSIDQLWGEKKNEPDPRYPRTRPLHEMLGSTFDVNLGEADLVCRRCSVRIVDPRRTPPPGLVSSSPGPGTGVITWTGPCTTYLTPREACQRIGTEMGRELWDGTWLRLATERLELLRDQDCPLAVVADVRFDNEARWVRAWPGGGELWRVGRPGAGLGGVAGAHASEAGVSDALVDRVLDNGGSLADLRATVAAWTRE